MAEAVRVVREIPRAFVRSADGRVSVKLKVAAYARVSTDKNEQEDSFERQVEYYTTYIKGRTDWEFVDIYADPGITGTRADKRPEFQRMLADCRAGKIQRILCKSIARFARNTVDALNAIRELKELGISIFFETQNIDTMTPGGDVLLTILAAMAEQESRTISSNVKWAMDKKKKNGEIMLNYTRFLGYTRDSEHNLVIVPEEAEVVRRIYREFLYGYSTASIAKRLTEQGIPTPSKKTKWGWRVIDSILHNEKYYGAAILGKTYQPDVLSKKRYKNEGQDTMYYVENSHPAIVSKEEFDLVQEELKRRKESRGYSATNEGKFASKYCFSKKIICGECGAIYRRHAAYYGGQYERTWVCAAHKMEGNGVCTQRDVMERELEVAFIAAVIQLVGDLSSLKETLYENIKTSLDDQTDYILFDTNHKITRAQDEMLKLIKERKNGTVSDSEYEERATALSELIDRLTAEKEDLTSQECEGKMVRRRIEEILQFLDTVNPTTEFNADIFKMTVDHIVMKDTLTAEFHFKVGAIITIPINRVRKRSPKPLAPPRPPKTPKA